MMMMMVMVMMMMMILGEVVDEFRQESKLKRIKEGDEVEVTLQDRLMFVRQVLIMSPVSPLHLHSTGGQRGPLLENIQNVEETGQGGGAGHSHGETSLLLSSIVTVPSTVFRAGC